jgi:hypothetical protein
MAAMPLSLALSRSLTTLAQEATPAPGAELTITITAHDFSFDIPDEVGAGYVTMTLINEGEEDHHAQLVKLNQGVTVDDFMAALEGGPEGVFPLVSFQGGPGVVAPGDQQTVIQQLSAGVFLALCFVESPDGVPHLAKGMIEQFMVVEAADPGEEPTADQEITLLDFEIEGIPSEVSSSRQVWRVTNDGPEPHELALLRLAEGVDLDMLMGMFGMEMDATPEPTNGDATPQAAVAAATPPDAAEGAMEGPPVFSAGGIQAMDVGTTGWMVLELEPADYVALCFVPSPEHQGQPHMALGMITSFTVTEG